MHKCSIARHIGGKPTVTIRYVYNDTWLQISIKCSLQCAAIVPNLVGTILMVRHFVTLLLSQTAQF